MLMCALTTLPILRRYHLPCARMLSVHRSRQGTQLNDFLITKGAASFMGAC